MIVTDMPDPADLDAGALLADRAGMLCDAMLRAIRLDRTQTYIASLFFRRPPGGMVEAADLAAAEARARAAGLGLWSACGGPHEPLGG